MLKRPSNAWGVGRVWQRVPFTKNAQAVANRFAVAAMISVRRVIAPLRDARLPGACFTFRELEIAASWANSTATVRISVKKIMECFAASTRSAAISAEWPFANGTTNRKKSQATGFQSTQQSVGAAKSALVARAASSVRSARSANVFLAAQRFASGRTRVAKQSKTTSVRSAGTRGAEKAMSRTAIQRSDAESRHL
jgi:hypothetical protein